MNGEKGRDEMMLKMMNEALDYMENHLSDEIDDRQIEKITGTSIYHFRRMFSYLSGMSLGEYVRNRKLSKATTDLLDGMSVTEVAFKYGYESVDGFSRAFKAWSGTNPSEVKGKNMLKAFPKLSFQLTVQGGVTMDYRIENMGPFKIVGKSKRVPLQFEGVNEEIVKLAQSITEEERKKLHTFANMEPHRVVNASYDFDEGWQEEKGSLTHMIGFLTTKESGFEGFDVVDVPALTWVIFSCKGEFPKVMQETMARFAAEWLPSSDYELVDAPNISFNGDMSDLSNVYSEIWYAVKKRGDGSTAS